tara:strand:- start:30394 stop:31776 length:1383 start_codon:yes stop_codon:yes gene_type:complete
MDSLKVVYLLFTATIIVALFMAVFQLVIEKKQIYFYSVLYWASILLSTVINLVVQDQQSLIFPLVGIGTFVSQTILALVICKVRNVNYNQKLGALVFIVAFIVTVISAQFFMVPFEIFGYLLSFGSAFPVFLAFYLVFKEKRSKFSSGQTLFFSIALLLTLHYLDYAYFKNKPEFFILALSIAFLIIHTLSALIPMVINEYSLFVKNQNLEMEIQHRLTDLRKADLQIWESNKLASLGQLSGVLAHELNSPLASISITAQSILKLVSSDKIDRDSVSERAFKIKSVVENISKMTSVLREAAGEKKISHRTQIDLKTVVEDIERSTFEYCAQKNIQFSTAYRGSYFNIIGNQNETVQAIRNFLSEAIEAIDSSVSPWIRIELLESEENILISFSDSRQNNSHFADDDLKKVKTKSFNIQNYSNLGLSMVVAKAIVEGQNGKIEFDFNSANRKTIVSFPKIK